MSLPEEWKPVKGFERYHVSSIGRVKNSKFERLMKSYKTTAGYFAIALVGSNGIPSKFLVHRLVAVAFIGEQAPGTTVDHIDRDTRNNMVTNLRWATLTEQRKNQKKRRTGYRGIWKCDKKTGEKIELFRNLRLAAESTATKSRSANPVQTIYAAARGSVKSAHGFKWVYEDDEVIEGEYGNLLTLNLSRGKKGTSSRAKVG